MGSSRQRRTRVRLALFASIGLGFLAFYSGVTTILDLAVGGGLVWKAEREGYAASEKGSREMFERLDLTAEECRATFPGLTKEVDDAVNRGPFQLKKAPGYTRGLVQGKIENGKLYVISAEKQPSMSMKWERDGVLQQVYRALITSPEPIPDMIFTFSILDYPRLGAWSFSRSNHPEATGNSWLMPHFSFWSWPLQFIGIMDEALTKIEKVERETPWEEKLDKAVWRGTGKFNSAGNTQLRPQLLALSEGKEWADVQALNWESQGQKAKNAIAIEDFCKYRYIIYTEGVTYSGRLPFHQACESIVLTPPPTYLLHTTHLLRPLFSSTLPFSSTPGKTDSRWSSYPASEANIVFVAPDWSDLEETLAYLRTHQDLAKGIAARQRALISEMGYLSAAAETCYWRALLRGWASVVRTDGDQAWETGELVRWETFAVRGEMGWG